MRYLSLVRQRAKREADKRRNAFRKEQVRCCKCGLAYGEPLDVHEIAAGGSRAQSARERCAWLLLCRTCHNEVQGWPREKMVQQYALKKRSDPDYYDRVALNRIRGRADDAITEAEVDEAMERIG